MVIAIIMGGCSTRADESEISEKLIGHWTISRTQSDGMSTVAMEGRGEYKDDGTSVGRVKFKISSLRNTVSCTVDTVNSWRIEGNCLIEKATKFEIIETKGNPLLLNSILMSLENSVSKETKGLIKHIDDEKGQVYNEVEKVTTNFCRIADEDS